MEFIVGHMQPFIMAARRCVDTQNWLGCLFICLSIPDICGKIEFPADKVGARYEKWYDAYLLKKYTVDQPGSTKRVFLSGKDCYALRCAYLHEGSTDITSQNAQDVLDRFHFTSRKAGFTIHNNIMNNALQLQVDIFCGDVCEGAEAWLKTALTDPAKAAQIAALAKIHSF